MTKHLSFIFLFLFATKAICQELLPPIEDFSKKKQAYLVKTDSTRIDFFLSKLYHKKGLIVYIEGETTKGEKFEMEADSVLILALPPTNSAKFTSMIESSRSLDKISQTNTDRLNPNLVYFFQEYVEDRKVTALLQLLNPDFSDKITIYHDPWAAETMGGGFGGLPIAGGIDKSYYLKVAGKTKRFFKKNYDLEFEKLFESCPSLINRYKKYKTIYWNDLPRNVYFFDTKCE
ncbi:MAG: hypothetical protein JNL70_17640 [Saprospiraceae bacterium]|nr:hypothetical protein [Saprospiraceae bacterium]